MRKAVWLALAFAALGLALGQKVPDPPTTYPPGPLGKLIKLGEDIVMHTNTHPLTKAYVGNKLQCKSCHLNGGKTKN
jgi:thiosulfate dehydrogenase